MPIYIQFEDIDGSVTQQGYENWIQVKSLHFGTDRPITTKSGNVTNRESSKPNIKEITLTKELDQTTPNLFSEACGGNAKTVKINVCNTGSDAYLALTLSNALISSYDVNPRDNGSAVTHEEALRLNFDKIEVRYTPYDEKNNMGTPVSTGYDLSSGVKL